MQDPTRGVGGLFRRTPDETFPSLDTLIGHCRQERDTSEDYWLTPTALWAKPVDTDRLLLASGDDRLFRMNDWSFGQLCRLAGVTKETVNRLTPETASRVFAETLPTGNKPLQIYAVGEQARSIHGSSYTRLYNADLLDFLLEAAGWFISLPDGANGTAALYCGEQDMFVFLIDPTGWIEIAGREFAPGFFIWNSEVGRRTLGIQTFWFQGTCRNRIVWDAVEVFDFSRKHTANIREALVEMRRIVGALAAKRDARRDAFARVIRTAMDTPLGDDAGEVQAQLAKVRICRALAREAIEMVAEQGPLTVFAIVDALTTLSRQIVNAGDRTQVDRQAGSLLNLAV